ncbi:MAG: FAD-dependent monooxygenase [Pontiellaceae bacterium]|nr:FAD-dependent monooxygenase [Pontiellaceae bacterium]MBN2783442.1 FAD-dependent monooxygenase [Pontiellaceae bacterium]
MNQTNHSLPQRITALIYGLGCHITFFTAVAAMAFSLFTGMRFGLGPFLGWASAAANALLLATFPISHSWLLTPKGRRFMAKLVPLGIGSKISMTVFVTLSSLQLFAAFVLWSPSGIIWWQAGAGLQICIGLVAALGWLLLGKSMADAQLDLQLGLVGWWAVFRNRKAVYKPFATRGLYRFVRQPIYISFAILLWLTTAWTPDQLVLALAWTAYCVVGAALKEKRFIRYFGDAFRAYQQRVPFWFPSFAVKTADQSVGERTTKKDADILIIGAGPIGLLLANLLGKRGVRVIVVERRTQPPKGSMAIGITPPSLDILKELELDQAFVRNGIPITDALVFENGTRIGGLNFSRLPSTHRCILSLPQNRTVALLRKNLNKFPSVTLLEGVQFVSRTEFTDGIRVRLQDTDAQAYSDLTATYLVGCDGHRSAVRTETRIAFPGHFYRTQFFMADFKDETNWAAEARLYFGRHGSVEAFPLSDGRRRWIVQMPLTASPDAHPIDSIVAEQIRRRTGMDLRATPAFFDSFFRPQRRLARTYRNGRVLLCGDAAHVMSPIGGQGMNTGFADAVHLDRAIAAALNDPLTADQHFREYSRVRRHAFRVAASRAARGMWLGTRRGMPASVLRRTLISRILLRPNIREQLARYFAMLTIPGNRTVISKRKVPA